MDLEAAVLAGVLEAELAAESSITAEPTCDNWHEEDFDPTDFEEVNLGDRDSRTLLEQGTVSDAVGLRACVTGPDFQRVPRQRTAHGHQRHHQAKTAPRAR